MDLDPQKVVAALNQHGAMLRKTISDGKDCEEDRTQIAAVLKDFEARLARLEAARLPPGEAEVDAELVEQDPLRFGEGDGES